MGPSLSSSILESALILVVGLTARKRSWIAQTLELAGARVRQADSPLEGLAACAEQLPHAAVIEAEPFDDELSDFAVRIRGLPDGDAVTLVAMLDRAGASEKARALKLGYDDAVESAAGVEATVALLIARMRRNRALAVGAVGRRLWPAHADDVVCVGPIAMHPSAFRVYVDGRPVALTISEFRLLKVLMQAPSRAIGRRELAEVLRRDGSAVQAEDGERSRAIDSMVFLLRKKLGEAGELVRTVRGVGYGVFPEGGRPGL